MFQIKPIPAFSDNYIWCVVNEDNQALVVDPGCDKSVEVFLKKHDLTLQAILITHHHPDHIGGVKALVQNHSPTVYGFQGANLDFLDQRFSDSQQFTVLGLSFTVIEVPGHTLDHIAFFVDVPGYSDINEEPKYNSTKSKPCLFCGDTLFSAGCGRLFEGTAEQMFRSLQKLTALPSDTRIFCAHEYTLSNLSFAQSLMPTNSALDAYLNTCKINREKGLPTLPSRMANELEFNPFLRCGDVELIQNLKKIINIEDNDPVKIFRALRKAKDIF